MEQPLFIFVGSSQLEKRAAPQSYFNSSETQNKTQLPDRLDRLLDEPWSQEASLKIDRWLWYVSQEFEGLEP